MFLHPWFMVAGGALVSAPVIIHLINRMRFKRIRWAAMEFLLKSQKRNRRRLIIEQLLLLAMRCFLVLLTALLVARFVGLSAHPFFQPQSTLHLVLLDDTLSMTDHWKDQSGDQSSYQTGRRMIKEIARRALLSGSSQQFMVLRLSRCDVAEFDFNERLNEQTRRQLDELLDDRLLADRPCSMLHIPPLKGLEAARELFAKEPAEKRWLHIVSDFRAHDWGDSGNEKLYAAIKSLCDTGVSVNFMDVAHPFRGESRQAALHHDNVGIVDLRPEARLAAKDMPVEFTVTIANFSASERKNVHLSVKVRGKEEFQGSQDLPPLPPGSSEHRFTLSLKQPGFNVVTAELVNQDMESGIVADNLRYAVVEVRERVPVLVIDGNGNEGRKPGGDSRHLEAALTTDKGYVVHFGSVADLENGFHLEVRKEGKERRILQDYPSIYLLNVPKLSDKQVRNLEHYVESGGSVAFFLGDKVAPAFYNRALYKDGSGLFPAPLALKSARTTPGDSDKPMTELEKSMAMLDGQFKIFVRNEKHPVFETIWDPKLRSVFKFLIVDRYWPVDRTYKAPRYLSGKGIEEWVTLPNRESIEPFKVSAQELNKELPVEEAAYKKYHKGLERHQRNVREALNKSLYDLASAFDELLNDPGVAEDADKPSMIEFWSLPDPKISNLRTRINALRERVQYGDPLIIAHKYGKGRVVACLTTAGKSWNDWAGGCPASPLYPIFILKLQRYLGSVGDEVNRKVGEPLGIRLDADRYEPRMHRRLQHLAHWGRQAEVGQEIAVQDLGEQPGTVDKNQVVFEFKDTRKPGVYVFDFHPLDDKTRVEQRAFVFNVDTLAEGDLKRAARDTMLAGNPREPSHRLGFRYFGNPEKSLDYIASKQPDLSERPWLYLVLLLILIVEQALAVYLSFHMKAGETQLPLPQVQTPAQATAA